MYMCAPEDTCSNAHNCAISNCQMGNHPKGLPTLEWISKLKTVRTMECYIRMRKKIMVTHNNMDKSQKGIVEQMSDTKRIHFMIPFTEASNGSH